MAKTTMSLHYSKTQLKNGLRIITAPKHDTNAVAVLILAKVGSRYETEAQAGLSHFLEHMFFKGTKKRPSYLHVSKELDGLGANFNAFTSEEYTGFYVQTSGDHFDQALDVLADMLLNGTMPEAEVIKERGVITEELNMYLDMPQSHVADLAKRTLFGQNPLGRPIIGYRKTIETTTRESLINYKHSFYQPPAMLVAVAGSGKPEHWRKMVEGYFGKLRTASRPGYERFSGSGTGGTVMLGSKKTDQAHFVLSLPSLARSDSRRYTLRVLNNALGGMMSSRLFTEIREKRGLAYYVGSGSEEYEETGAFFIRAGVPTTKIEEAITVVCKELKKITETKLRAEELTRAKENIKGRTYLELEDSFAVANFLAEQELFLNTIDQPEAMIAKVEAVTASDIIELARELVRPELLRLAVVGPYEDEEPFKKIFN
ncbi:insulinase family protein [Candidatus Berkelbacteria bacterium]|nr:insulinase family protein [Candidatus Berkelbacteria bacterium]